MEDNGNKMTNDMFYDSHHQQLSRYSILDAMSIEAFDSGFRFNVCEYW